MSFSCPIESLWVSGQACSRIRLALTVIGSAGELVHEFRFDTGCDTTTVSEDVATALGLPTGGAPVGIRGSTGTARGRFVSVTFRFPPDAVSGSNGPEVNSTWIVVAAGTAVALLSLHEVRGLYNFWTDDTTIYFTDR